jgi:thymidylate synthase
MKQYLEFLKHINNNGIIKSDRTGVGTKSVFGYQMRFNLQEGFPLITTKKVHLKSVIYELLFFLSGDTNNNTLKKNGISIWDEWAREDGELGPIYSAMWRNWPSYNENEITYIDQIQNLVDGIKNNPNSRRNLVVAYNPSVVDKVVLPPCHAMFQFYVADNKLSCHLFQRSADAALGVPFNIASYALLTHMIAQQCNLDVGEFVWSGSDCHIYLNHIEGVNEQLTRKPFNLSKLNIKRKPDSIFDYKYDDFEIVDYEYHPHIKFQVAV